VSEALLLAHAAVSLPLVGLIWFVQVVHYPLFALVGTDRWDAYHEAHRFRTGLVVGAPMLAQLATAAALVLDDARPLTVASLALTVGVFLHTFLVAVPDHERLGRAHDPAVVARLARLNGIRTALWTAQGAVVVALLASAL
jgi:hypothetical protein